MMRVAPTFKFANKTQNALLLLIGNQSGSKSYKGDVKVKLFLIVVKQTIKYITLHFI
jgi:hypothetical protein